MRGRRGPVPSRVGVGDDLRPSERPAPASQRAPTRSSLRDRRGDRTSAGEIQGGTVRDLRGARRRGRERDGLAGPGAARRGPRSESSDGDVGAGGRGIRVATVAAVAALAVVRGNDVARIRSGRTPIRHRRRPSGDTAPCHLQPRCGRHRGCRRDRLQRATVRARRHRPLSVRRHLTTPPARRARRRARPRRQPVRRRARSTSTSRTTTGGGGRSGRSRNPCRATTSTTATRNRTPTAISRTGVRRRRDTRVRVPELRSAARLHAGNGHVLAHRRAQLRALSPPRRLRSRSEGNDPGGRQRDVPMAEARPGGTSERRLPMHAGVLAPSALLVLARERSHAGGRAALGVALRRWSRRRPQLELAQLSAVGAAGPRGPARPGRRDLREFVIGTGGVKKDAAHLRCVAGGARRRPGHHVRHHRDRTARAGFTWKWMSAEDQPAFSDTQTEPVACH